MGLNDTLEKIDKRLEEMEARKSKKPKDFKLPFGKKVGNAQKKKNYVTILRINENGQISFDKEPIEEQTTIMDKVPRLATPDHVLFFKKNPMIIQPSWSVEPFCPKEHFKKSLEDGSNKNGFQLLMNRMKLSELTGKKKMKGWVAWIFGGIVAVIIGYAIFTGGI